MAKAKANSNGKTKRTYSKKKGGKKSKTPYQKLAKRVRGLETESQIKRSYTPITNAIVDDDKLYCWAIDHVPISTNTSTDAYGRMANTTKVVGKKLELRMNVHADSTTPYNCEVKALLLRSQMKDATGAIIPPVISDLYDIFNVPQGQEMPPWRMFKPPGSTTEVYETVEVLKEWTFKLSSVEVNTNGQVENNAVPTANQYQQNAERPLYPIRKWLYHTVNLNDEVFKFGNGLQTVPLGPYRYFICFMSTCLRANHEAVIVDGTVKFTYKDD